MQVEYARCCRGSNWLTRHVGATGRVPLSRPLRFLFDIISFQKNLQLWGVPLCLSTCFDQPPIPLYPDPSAFGPLYPACSCQRPLLSHLHRRRCPRSSKQASKLSILTCAPPPSPCQSQPAAQTAMPPSASPKMAVRLPSSSRSTACLCSSTRRAQVPPLTLPQTFAPSANRRATSIPTCSSKSIRSATTKCASRVWTASSATGPHHVPLRDARGRSERQSSASRLLRI
jgi:hypothetical protein